MPNRKRDHQEKRVLMRGNQEKREPTMRRDLQERREPITRRDPQEMKVKRAKDLRVKKAEKDHQEMMSKDQMLKVKDQNIQKKLQFLLNITG